MNLSMASRMRPRASSFSVADRLAGSIRNTIRTVLSGVAVPVIPDEALVSAWAFDRLDAVRGDLAAQAIGLWQCFLRHAQMSGLEAEEATIAWIDRQRSAEAAQRAGSEA